MDTATRARLLAVARGAVEATVRGEKLPPLPDDPSIHLESSGAFVTIRNAERLRGCMGTFRSCENLAKMVANIAGTAARDPRFVTMPITPDELPILRLEVSVLSPLHRTEDPLSLVPGTHGIYIVRGKRSGCFLPQVATEQGWDAREFLERCCATKAGLPADAWHAPETEVYLFTSEAFAEDGYHEKTTQPIAPVRLSK